MVATRRRRPPLRALSWIVMGPEPWLASCLRCGDVLRSPKMPVEIGPLARFLKAWADIHRDCAEPEAGS